VGVRFRVSLRQATTLARYCLAKECGPRKQIKRIGLIRYTDTRPNDYWANLGYDWYAGL
jgi:hypothetical protein